MVRSIPFLYAYRFVAKETLGVSNQHTLGLAHLIAWMAHRAG